MITKEEFYELVEFVSDNINHDLDRYTRNIMREEHIVSLGYACEELDERISELVEQWFYDNGYEYDDYCKFFDTYHTQDIFNSKHYKFDKH